MTWTERGALIAVSDGGFDAAGNPLVRVRIGAGIDIALPPATAEKLGMDLVTEAPPGPGQGAAVKKTLLYACDAVGCDAGGRIRAFTIRGAIAIAQDSGWQLVEGPDDPVLCPDHVANPPETVLR